MLNYTSMGYRGEEEPRGEDAAGAPEQIQLAIKLDGESSEHECAVCGEERVSAEGPELNAFAAR